ncbi:hypothetical protein GCM10022219_22180 [Microbacterium oryzae]|uniref:DUF7882 domain-containing protein n=1 Tax=Microbacterium oryzae TaxID=743009 RepID=A0A6I6E035_9MICO|nr:hypothetical protein [Microbacterium oryzae]QGU27554.1 hypothetical protein D7D94_07665 [Microbacterium oryzae]
MGTLHYGLEGAPIHMPDRTLAHLRTVIATKLRRHESFTITWRHRTDQEQGRSTIWMHESIPLRFVFSSPTPVEMDPRWLGDLADAAGSSTGIILSDADTAPAAALTPVPVRRAA